MKKLIAIAMVFALVAGAAFAADFGAQVAGHINVAEGTSQNPADAPNDVGASGGVNGASISASGQNEEGTFGGSFKIKGDGGNWDMKGSEKDDATGNLKSAVFYPELKVWWKPIEQFKFTFNYSDDGYFEQSGITRWNFHQVAGDVGVADEGSAWGGSPENAAAGVTFSDAFYGGWNNGGAIFTIAPISGLEVNIAVPFLNGGRGEDIYKKTAVQVAYKLEGIGSLAVTFDGYSGDSNKGGTGPWNPGKLWGYFNLTAIENLSVDIGFGVPFYQIEDPDYKLFNMAAGFGVKYDLGAFGVKARFVANMGSSSSKVGDKTFTTYNGLGFILDVMPYYAINDTLSVNLSFGFGGKGATSDSENGVQEGTAVEPGWHVNPFITIKGGWWAPNFYAGVRFWSKNVGNETDTDGNALIYWSIPIGIVFAF
jgi:hypothetical protein